MRKLPKSTVHNYTGLRLTKNDIRQIHTLVISQCAPHVDMTAGDYRLDSIDDIDSIPEPFVGSFELSCQYASRSGDSQTTQQPIVSNLTLLIGRTQAILTLENQDNTIAFGITEKIHNILAKRTLPNSYYIFRGLVGIMAVLAVCMLAITTFGAPIMLTALVGGLSVLLLFMVIIESSQPSIIYLSPIQPGYWVRHKDQFAVKAVEIIMTVVLTAIVTGAIIGPISYYLGKGQQQPTTVTPQTPSSSTQPTTAPAKKIP
jgi:hypothetical protein